MPRKIISLGIVILFFSTSSFTIAIATKKEFQNLDEKNVSYFPTEYIELWYNSTGNSYLNKDENQIDKKDITKCTDGLDLIIDWVDAWWSPNPYYPPNCEYGFISHQITIINIGKSYKGEKEEWAYIDVYLDNKTFFRHELNFIEWQAYLYRPTVIFIWAPYIKARELKAKVSTTADESKTSNNVEIITVNNGITIDITAYLEKQGAKTPLYKANISCLSEIIYYNPFYSNSFTDKSGKISLTAPYKKNSGQSSTYTIRAEYNNEVIMKTTPKPIKNITYIELSFGKKSREFDLKLPNLLIKFFEKQFQVFAIFKKLWHNEQIKKHFY